MSKSITPDALAGVEASTSDKTPVVPSVELLTKKLDKLLEYAEKTISDADLAQQEFDLKSKVTTQGLAHQKIEFYTLLIAKATVMLLAIAMVVLTACKFSFFLSSTSPLPDPFAKNPHVLLALVIGSFLTIFGICAALLKGLGQSEKSNTPLAAEEVIKAILAVFKATK